MVLRRKKEVFITGNSGKTYLSSMLIRNTNRRVLYLINRIELVNQTAKEYEDMLGIKVGKCVEGKMDISSQITVSSIQTLFSILKRKNNETIELKKFLYNVTCIILDEAQLVNISLKNKIIGNKKIKTKGMYGLISDELRNIEYICAMSGSPIRDGDDVLEMNSLTGFIEYAKSTKELEKLGYLTPSEIYFLSENLVEMTNFKFLILQ